MLEPTMSRNIWKQKLGIGTGKWAKRNSSNLKLDEKVCGVSEQKIDQVYREGRGGESKLFEQKIERIWAVNSKLFNQKKKLNFVAKSKLV
jgi:hypothetical protein